MAEETDPVGVGDDPDYVHGGGGDSWSTACSSPHSGPASRPPCARRSTIRRRRRSSCRTACAPRRAPTRHGCASFPASINLDNTPGANWKLRVVTSGPVNCAVTRRRAVRALRAPCPVPAADAVAVNLEAVRLHDHGIFQLDEAAARMLQRGLHRHHHAGFERPVGTKGVVRHRAGIGRRGASWLTSPCRGRGSERDCAASIDAARRRLRRRFPCRARRHGSAASMPARRYWTLCFDVATRTSIPVSSISRSSRAVSNGAVCGCLVTSKRMVGLLIAGIQDYWLGRLSIRRVG